MKIVIVEDEKAAITRLSNQLKEIRPGYSVIATIDGVEAAIDWFTNNHAPDLIFLDVQLSDGISFEIFGKVKVSAPIIFTTAFDNYTMKAFELNSIDYLLKPINIEKLQIAISKFEKMKEIFHHDALEYQIKSLLNTFKTQQEPYKSRFLISQHDGYTPVQVEDISYFHAEDNCIIITTKKNEHFTFHYSLDKLEQELDPKLFWRANRAFIISAASIRKANNYFNYKIKLELVPETSKEVIISRKNVSDFKTWFNL